MAFTLADATLEKFGGDSLPETARNLDRLPGGAPVIVYLVGMPGSGKSTVGAELGGRLGVPFVDLDAEIARRDGRSITQIFDEEGEPGFRAHRGSRARGRLDAGPRGDRLRGRRGARAREPDHVAQHGHVRVPRCADLGAGGAGRPSAERPLIRATGDLQRLLEEREPLYREFAAHVVDGSGDARRGCGRDRGGAALVRVTVPVAGALLRRDDRHRCGRRRRGASARSRAGGARVRRGRPRPWRRPGFRRWRRSLRRGGSHAVPLAVPSGEAAKTLQVYGTLLHQLASQEAHRDDVVVALGGGAVGDLAGFVAIDLHARRAVRAGAHDVDGAGRRGDRWQDRGQPARGQEPRGHVPPAGRGAVPTWPRWRRCPTGTSARGWPRWRSTRSRSTSSCSTLLEREPGPVARARAGGAGGAGGPMRRARRPRPSPRTSGTRAAGWSSTTATRSGHALERLDAFAGPLARGGDRDRHGVRRAAGRGAGLARPGSSARTSRLLASLGLETDGALPPVDDILAAFRMDKKYRGGVRFVLLEDVGRPVGRRGGPRATRCVTVLTEMGAAG